MLPSYRVYVKNKDTNTYEFGFLGEAQKEDMPPLNANGWTCFWERFWEISDFEYEAIIKFSYYQQIDGQPKVLGLCRLGIYPFMDQEGIPEVEKKWFLDITNLESIQGKGNRPPIIPIGQWLVWYAVDMAFTYCSPDDPNCLVTVDSLEQAIPYYRSVIGMDGVGYKEGAPGEEIYAFKFTKTQAKQFHDRMGNIYGFPLRLPPTESE